MRHIFVEGRRLLASLHYLFSRKARLGNRYDEHDLLLGHGVDNLTGLRVVMLMACCALFTLWVAMLLKPAVSTAIAFFLLFSYLCHYTQTMPRAGITDYLNSEAHRAGGRYAYRSYLGGRIVFTPSGLRLSWHSSQRPDSTPNAQQGPTPTLDPKQQAKALCAAISSLPKEDSGNAASDGGDGGMLQRLKRVGEHISKGAKKLRLLDQTTYSDDLPVGQSGYMTEHVPASLQQYLVHAGCKLRLDQLEELTEANLPHLSQESREMLLPSQVCCLGFGYKWLPKHTRRLHDIMAVGTRSASGKNKGSPDLHGVEDYRAFEPIYLRSELLLGHTLLLGTTGAGKTRFFDLLVSQAIMRGDTVIVIDPKGDRSLQQSILRAARFSGREPLEDVFCLDIGRKQSRKLCSSSGFAFAQRSAGVLYPMGSQSMPQHSLFGRRARKENRKLTQRVDQHIRDNSDQSLFPVDPLGSLVPELNPAIEQVTEYSPAVCRSLKHEYIPPEHMLTQQRKTGLSPEEVCLGSKAEGTAGSAARSYASSFAVHPAEAISTISPTSATGLDEAKEASWFFDHINTGFNPTSAFDRASEIGDRITAMMSAAGSGASFKAYAHMAVSAAVECCVITDEPVTLEKIRSIVSDHSNFEQSLRIYLNRLVIALNERAATIYYNRLHGIKSKKLQHNRFAVQLLLGPSGVGKASVQSELKAIATLEQYGYDLSDETADSSSSAGVAIPDNVLAEFAQEDEEESIQYNKENLVKDSRTTRASHRTRKSSGFASKKAPEIVAKVPRKSCASAAASSTSQEAWASDAEGIAGAAASSASGCKRNSTKSSFPSSLESTIAQLSQDELLAEAIGDRSVKMDPSLGQEAQDGLHSNMAFVLSKASAARATSSYHVPSGAGDDGAVKAEAKPKTGSKAKSGTGRTKAKVVAYTASFSKLLEFYRWLQQEELIQGEYGIEQIIGICALSPEFYKKVTNGILPYLSALTSGELMGLLSSSEEVLPSFMDLVARNKIFYAALHCLKDCTTGQALGKLLISDLAFVAGEINAKGIDSHHRVSIFIDEVAELSNEGSTQY